MDAEGVCAAAGLPAPALHVDQNAIPGRAPRGNAAWLDAVAEGLSLRRNQLLLVGTTEYDWYTGIHAGVVYVHAKWAKANEKRVTSLGADAPSDVQEFVENYVLSEPSWAFAHDDAERSFRIRSMLGPNAQFPASAPASFTLQDVFTYGRKIDIGDQDARDFLMLQLLCSAYLDDCLP